VPPGEHQNVFVTAGQYVGGKDFGNIGSSPIQDLSCYIGGGAARPGFAKSYGITYQNNGNVPVNATLVNMLPRDVLYLYCSHGGVYLDDGTDQTVTWNLGTLPPAYIGWLTVVVRVPPGIPIGWTLTSGAEIQPLMGDNSPLDNRASESQTVTGSFDPNEKLVTPEGIIERTDMLTYQINFQNVGNDTAFTIVVRDTLDPNLDLATFASGASIHPYTYATNGREIVWTFADILLPDSIVNEPGSHGFVKFTAYPSPGVPPGTIIENRASIFFDFNPPVVTNTVSNQIAMAPPCAYVPGEMNGIGGPNGIDVVYGVNFLKGGAPPTIECNPPCLTYINPQPPYQQLPLPDPFYAAMDVNGNCAANGIDITYFVNFLKGIQPALLYCADCPPAVR
jgi:uncharacterized repeat protein (TIGR01451 family)